MIRKNIKLLIGLMIGIISVGGVYAVSNLNASSVTIDKNNMVTIESGVLHEAQTYLGIAYLDPTDLSIKCTVANSVSLAGTKIGCMK